MQDVKASELEKINKPKASDDDMIPDEFPTEESDDAAHAAVMGHVLNLVPDKQRQAVREESLRFKERQNPIHRPRYDHMFSYHFYFILLILRTHPRIHINCICTGLRSGTTTTTKKTHPRFYRRMWRRQQPQRRRRRRQRLWRTRPRMIPSLTTDPLIKYNVIYNEVHLIPKVLYC